MGNKEIKIKDFGENIGDKQGSQNFRINLKINRNFMLRSKITFC